MSLLSLALTIALSPAAAAFNVDSFSPQGMVKKPRQVRAVFNEAITIFGDPRAAEPFEIECSVKEKGKGLWEDPRTWIYEFPTELKSGERCTFHPKLDLRSAKGGAWEKGAIYSFHTGAPAIIASQPSDGGQLEESQGFLFLLDGPVDLKSVEKNVYLLVEGVSEKIPLKILPDSVRDQMAETSWQYRRRKEDKQELYPLALETARPLPTNKRVQLVWGKGVRSVSGIEQEKDHMLAFRTREPFRATFSCTRENANTPCSPIEGLYLSFNSPIARAQAQKVRFLADGKELKAETSKNETVSSLTVRGPLPAKAKLSIELPKGLTDEAGRALSNAGKFPLASATADYPPLAKFAAVFGILEAADPVLPVTVRRLEGALAGTKLVGAKANLTGDNPKAVIDLFRSLHGKEGSYFKYEGDKVIDRRGGPLLTNGEAFSLPKPNGPDAFEVVGIPLGKPGFHVVEIRSEKLGASLISPPKPMYVAAGALVTDMAVHLKWGAANSLIWVTSLSSGTPIGGAQVTVVDCAGKTVWEGKTEKDGAVIAEGMPRADAMPYCDADDEYRYGNGAFVFAKKDGDFSFVHSSWNNGFESWRFQLPFETSGGEREAHAIFDRTLLRVGQTVHMRFLLREKVLSGFRVPAESPKFAVLQPAVGPRVILPVNFDQNGHAETEWKIPEGAKLGRYEVYLANKEPKADEEYYSPEEGYSAGVFRVEEFRLPVMAGSLQWPKSPPVGVKQLPVDLSLRYLAGGGAGAAKVKVRARVENSGGMSFAEFEDFSFANGRPAQGRKRRSYDSDERKKATNLPEQNLTLDASGGARAQLTGIPASDQPQRLVAEMEYRDPSGETQTVSGRTLILPSAVLVGIKPEGWAAQKDDVRFTVAVASAEGKPLAGQAVSVSWAERKVFSHRKRIVGGFYSYENFEETKTHGPACAGTTDARGLVHCQGKAPASGNLILLAEADGGKSVSHREIWVTGGDDWWFEQENHDRIDLLPEKKRYEPGENARFQVRTPFRDATALVTVEREGIIERFTQKISGKEPVIEVPVRESFAPNVYVSALVVRGRVSSPAPTALVDLARPAFKLGISQIQVGWRAHELKVSVSPERAVYPVRAKAKVRVKVTRALDGKPAAKAIATLAAVDEALLELADNSSWKVLEAMMQPRPLRVTNATAQSQVVGKRHYGLKALPAGGGGGMSSARELFDTLLLWKGEVKLDGDGQAEVEVPLNDSLTSFRIVAIALEGADRFGRGEGSVRTHQDLMLFSGVAPLARERDQTQPELTIRNAGEKPKKVRLAGRVNTLPLLAEKVVEVAAGASQTVRWEYTIPPEVISLNYEFTAQEDGGEARDQLKVSQKVQPVLEVSTVQATLERVKPRLVYPAAPPAGAVEGTGALVARLEPTLVAGLEPMESYMFNYPYSCLEQKVSRSVALGDRKEWEEIVKKLSVYIDEGGLLKYFPEMRYGSDTLTAYVLSLAHEAGYPIPAADLRRLTQGLQGFVTGKSYAAGFIYPAADLAVRKLAAMEALSRHNTFDPAWLSLIQVEPELWPTRALFDWWGILQREQKIKEREKLLAQLNQVLRARVEWRGTTVGFKSSMRLWWLMDSEDVSANRLLLAASADPTWTNDIGRLARGVLARQKKGRWDLTTANAWGSLAFARFSEHHEKETVKGKTTASYGKNSQTFAWQTESEKKITQNSVEFPWQKGKAELVLQHEGEGAPWALLESRAAVQLREPIFKGYRLSRSVAPVQQKQKGKWSVGDVARVTLKLEAPADMTWVVITDPIPAGSTVLGSGLGRDSELLSSSKAMGAYTERSFAHYRAYYEWLPKGSHTIEYTVRLNGAGKFALPNTRAEAMYAPDFYAEMPNQAVTIAP